MSGRKNPEVYSLIISDAEFFGMVQYLFTAIGIPPSGSGWWTCTKIGETVLKDKQYKNTKYAK